MILMEASTIQNRDYFRLVFSLHVWSELAQFSICMQYRIAVRAVAFQACLLDDDIQIGSRE